MCHISKKILNKSTIKDLNLFETMSVHRADILFYVYLSDVSLKILHSKCISIENMCNITTSVMSDFTALAHPLPQLSRWRLNVASLSEQYGGSCYTALILFVVRFASTIRLVNTDLVYFFLIYGILTMIGRLQYCKIPIKYSV